MKFLKFILWGKEPSKKSLDRMMQARPKDTPLAEWASHLNKKLTGK